MEAFYTAIRRHRRLNFILAGCFSILIGCCTFPILPLTGEWPSFLPVNLLIACAAYYEIGNWLGALFDRVSILPIVFLNLGLAGLGVGCRFLLEFGEISNVCNFTWPNVSLHLLVSSLYPLVLCFWTAAHRPYHTK
ncbi:hypothetical protein KQI82_13970 [Oscillibacter sp. MSJ-2]|uniref:Rod shape-determining protein MreD n=1 Tax=Dysosmobacter acutus TaxID=2841504 RepID=A0ABS6FF76_9FIRM|nr:hypothetical protein [Dysosmobacter acutus]MBU5628015.1 hypothetical protein [Dysosmobacter acutus]